MGNIGETYPGLYVDKIFENNVPVTGFSTRQHFGNWSEGFSRGYKYGGYLLNASKK